MSTESKTTLWPITIDVPVAWGDMDAFGHVNNTVYLRWFESARIAYFDRVALIGEMKATGTGPILARASVNFRKPVTYPDRVAVSARITDVRTTSFTMIYSACSAGLGGALVAEGDSVVVMIDYGSGEKRAVNEDLRKRIATLEGARIS